MSAGEFKNFKDLLKATGGTPKSDEKPAVEYSGGLEQRAEELGERALDATSRERISGRPAAFAAMDHGPLPYRDEGSEEILLISSNGVVIRTPLDQIRVLGRATMGVKVMTVGEAKIASIATFSSTRPTQTQLPVR